MPRRAGPTPRRATRSAVADGEISPPRSAGRSPPSAAARRRGAAFTPWWLALPTRAAFSLLLAARLAAAAWHIVHDCDEVYNYWEPLHFLLRGTGFQTWEYSAKFALRPWAYVALHAPAAAAAGGAGVRAALATATAAVETALFASLRDVAGPGTATAFLALALPSPGMYAAAPALLPSSFVMVAHAAGTAAALRLVAAARAGGGKKAKAAAAVATASTRTILAAAVGLLWGWPVAAPAFLPHAAAVLAWGPSLAASLATAGATTALLLAPLIAVDRAAYGRWTLSLANFLAYNVAGGGESALYGVEPPSFYAKAAALALGGALPLALAAPLLGFLASRGRGRGPATPPPGAGVAVAVAAGLPAALWVAAITALPHKEDRFLYPAFPAVHAVAGFGLACLPAAVRGLAGVTAGGSEAGKGTARAAWTAAVRGVAATKPAVLVVLSAALGLARAAALFSYYSAPRTVWAALPPTPGPAFSPATPATVCMGAEWHRFPGSFALPPSGLYRPAFVASGFGGLLPVPFNAAAGGAAAAPATLNDRNRHEAANELPDAGGCDYFVGVAAEDGGDAPTGEAAWRVVAAAPFVDAAASRSAPERWLRVPGVRSLDGAGNAWVKYVLLQRTGGGGGKA